MGKRLVVRVLTVSALLGGSLAAQEPPSISDLTPRQRADRLFDRTMRAYEFGDSADALRFAPMALFAFSELPTLDLDARLHIGLLELVRKNPNGARAQAVVIHQQDSSAQPVSWYLWAHVAKQKGMNDLLAVSYRNFLRTWETGKARHPTIWRDHGVLMEEFLNEARRYQATRTVVAGAGSDVTQTSPPQNLGIRQASSPIKTLPPLQPSHSSVVASWRSAIDAIGSDATCVSEVAPRIKRSFQYEIQRVAKHEELRAGNFTQQDYDIMLANADNIVDLYAKADFCVRLHSTIANLFRSEAARIRAHISGRPSTLVASAPEPDVPSASGPARNSTLADVAKVVAQGLLETHGTRKAGQPNPPPPRTQPPRPEPTPLPPAPQSPDGPRSDPSDGTGQSSIPRFPQPTNTGRSPARIMVYTTSMSSGAVNVFIDDLVQGGLVRALDPGQQCQAPGAITVTVTPGYHKLFAEAVGKRASWGPVTRQVREGECYVWPLNAAVNSGQSASGARDDSRRQVTYVTIWTRRSLHLERLDVFLEGRPLVPASWSFSSDPTDCTRLPMHATQEHKSGDRVLLEVRKSVSADPRTPVVLSDRILVPNPPCVLYELR